MATFYSQVILPMTRRERDELAHEASQNSLWMHVGLGAVSAMHLIRHSTAARGQICKQACRGSRAGDTRSDLLHKDVVFSLGVHHKYPPQNRLQAECHHHLAVLQVALLVLNHSAVGHGLHGHPLQNRSPWEHYPSRIMQEFRVHTLWQCQRYTISSANPPRRGMQLTLGLVSPPKKRKENNHFTSSDPHGCMSRHLFWHSIWHSVCHSLWHVLGLRATSQPLELVIWHRVRATRQPLSLQRGTGSRTTSQLPMAARPRPLHTRALHPALATWPGSKHSPQRPELAERGSRRGGGGRSCSGNFV